MTFGTVNIIMVLTTFADPFLSHESALDHGICVMKQRGSITNIWGNVGPLQRMHFLINLIPMILHSSTCECSVTMALRNATLQRKCVISHVVSVKLSINRYRGSLAGRPLPWCLCETKLNTIRERKKTPQSQSPQLVKQRFLTPKAVDVMAEPPPSL